MKLFSFRLFLNYLLSYVMLIVIFVLCLSPLYLILIDQVKENNISSTVSNLNMAASNVDNSINSLNDTVNQLFYQPSYRLIATSKDSKQSYFYTDPVNVASRIEGITYAFDMVSYAYATFGNNSHLVDNVRLYQTRQEFYDNVLFYPTISYEVWDKWLDQKQGALWPVHLVELHKGLYSQEYLTYHYKNTYLSAVNNFTCLIRKDYFEKSFLPSDIKDTGFIYLTDETGEIYLDSGYEAENPVNFSKNGQKIKVNNKHYIVTKTHIKSLGMDVILGIPVYYYISSLSQVNKGIRLYIIIALLVTTIISLVLTYFKVAPIKKVINHMDTLGLSDYKEKDLNNYLLSTFHKMIKRQNLVSDELESAAQMLENSYAEMFIRNGIATEQALIKLTKMFHLTKHNYLILVDISHLAINHNLLILTVKENVKEIYKQNFYIHATTDNMILIFSNLQTGSKEEYQELKALNSHLLNILPSETKISVSAEFAEIEDVSDRFWETRNWILSGFVNPGEIAYVKTKELKPTEIVDMNDLNKLNEYLLVGEADRAALYIDQICNIEQMDTQNFTQLFYSLRGILVSVANKVNYIDTKQYYDYDANLPRTFLIDKLKEFALAICNHIDDVKRSHHEQLQQKILRFIDENYANANMSASMVADKFGISRKYFSAFLKEQTNKTYTEYVEDLRLAKATLMLKETDISITEIAIDCGYSSQNTFYKAFKRKYDVSPSFIRR